MLSLVGAIVTSNLEQLLSNRPSFRYPVILVCDAISLNNMLEIWYIGESVGKFETGEVSTALGL